MKIRDLRNGEWFWVNNAVMSCPHIDAETYRVYSTLASFGGMPEIRPTVATISQKSCVSIRKVNYSIKKLVEIGFVEIKIGGGRGRSNVYNLLKAVKGCTICSVSKPCTNEQETLHETTINSAHGAHHKDIYKNKDKYIAAETAAPQEFSLKEEILKLYNSPRRDLNLIGWYFEKRKVDIRDKKQLQSSLTRHLRAAKQLSPFSDEQIGKAHRYVASEYPEWTLETIIKKLSK